jgi:hypothetical protein
MWNLTEWVCTQETQSLRSERARQMMMSLRRKECSAATLAQKLPKAAEDEQVFIVSSLVFSASKRISAAGAMALPFFDSIRSVPAAQIPHVETPDLSSDPGAAFVFDDARWVREKSLLLVMPLVWLIIG